jgi:hypothetical protein
VELKGRKKKYSGGVSHDLTFLYFATAAAAARQTLKTFFFKSYF